VNRRALLAPLPVLLCGCGYIGDTRPPTLNLPVPVTDLTAFEKGSKIEVQFSVPQRNTDDLLLRDKPHMVVYVGARPFDNVQSGESTAHAEIDASPFYGQDVKVTVRALNKRDRDAGPSNSVALHVIPALQPPANLKAAAVAAGIQLTWNSPEKNFTIFRQGPGETKLTKLDTATASPYIDKNTEYGKEYRYAVQASSGSAESELSELPKPYVPVDTFPPATPVALAAVVGTQSVELVWDRGIEPDLAGYRIYRDAGSGQFEKIGESRDAPSFSDKTVEKGKRYRYAVTAYDTSGNESGLSEPAEAVIP
jgi:fibronectin type 3 domain-containing protein